MSKISEQKALEAYPMDEYEFDKAKKSDIERKRFAYIKGYDQAMQDFLEKACEWLSNRIGINQEVVTNEEGQPLADSYIQYLEERAKAVKEITEDFKNYMQNEM